MLNTEKYKKLIKYTIPDDNAKDMPLSGGKAGLSFFVTQELPKV